MFSIQLPFSFYSTWYTNRPLQASAHFFIIGAWNILASCGVEHHLRVAGQSGQSEQSERGILGNNMLQNSPNLCGILNEVGCWQEIG
jgi:hypothetical protein